MCYTYTNLNYKSNLNVWLQLHILQSKYVEKIWIYYHLTHFNVLLDLLLFSCKNFRVWSNPIWWETAHSRNQRRRRRLNPYVGVDQYLPKATSEVTCDRTGHDLLEGVRRWRRCVRHCPVSRCHVRLAHVTTRPRERVEVLQTRWPTSVCVYVSQYTRSSSFLFGLCCYLLDFKANDMSDNSGLFGCFMVVIANF